MVYGEGVSVAVAGGHPPPCSWDLPHRRGSCCYGWTLKVVSVDIYFLEMLSACYSEWVLFVATFV